MAFERDEVRFSGFFPPSDKDEGNAGGLRKTGLVLAPYGDFAIEPGRVVGVTLLTGFLT